MRTDNMIYNFRKNNGFTLDKNLGRVCAYFNTNCIVLEITKKQGVTL